MTSKSFGAKNIDVSSDLNVSGVGTFTTGLKISGYLQDKDGDTGNDNQVLISKDDGGSQKVEWANLSAVTSNNDSAGIGFTDLNDTPSALGGAGKIITVNASNTELEFSTNNFLNLDDTPINYSGQGGKLVAVKTDLSGTQKIEFVDNTSNTNTGLMPSGSIIAWGGKYSTIPSGYLFCDGSAHSRTTYSTLFAALGTIHGSGDGSTTFNIPDLKNKFIIGANTSETAETFPGIAAGKTGGSANAIVVEHRHGNGTLEASGTVTGGVHSHEISNDSHQHSITDPEHNHGGVVGKQRAENTENAFQVIVDDDHTGSNKTDQQAINAAATGITGTNPASTNITINNSDLLSFNVDASVSGETSDFGDDGQNANLPPYYALCYIIKT